MWKEVVLFYVLTIFDLVSFFKNKNKNERVVVKVWIWRSLSKKVMNAKENMFCMVTQSLQRKLNQVRNWQNEIVESKDDEHPTIKKKCNFSHLNKCNI
jgi:hypothetical protein